MSETSFISQPKGTLEFDPLKDLIDNTSEVIMMLTPSLDFLFVNHSFHETLGYTKKELSTMKLGDILHPQFINDILSKLKEVEKGIHVQDFQMVVRNKENKRVYLSGDVNCRFEKGKPVNFRCLLRDITQRRRAEKAQNLYYSIAQSNLNTENLEDFLEQVHLELQNNLYANNFFVAVYEKEEGTIYFPYHVDEHYDTEKKYNRRKLGNGIIEYAMVKNKPLLFYNKDLVRLKEKEKVVMYNTILPAIQIIVPLKVKNKTVGVIGIKSYSDATKFGSRDLELLEFVSGQVALALQRKKAEASLLLQTARLNAVFDSSTHFIWTVDQKRHLSSFNKNYYSLMEDKLGVPPEINVSTEILGWKLIAPQDRPILREKYNQAFEGNPQYFEMNWGERDGGNEWYEFYLNPILSSDSGEIQEVSGIARNITEKKNAILSIQKSEGKFRNIIESFIDIYYRTDLAGNVTMISPSVLKHTGYSLEEVKGNKVDKFFENTDNSSQNIKHLLKNGSITNFEVPVKRKDGELRQFMLNIRMITDNKGIPKEVEGVARDISDLKNSSIELQKAKEEAEKSLKVKEQFLANMSHEIRTPMNGIIGMIDVLNETKLGNEQKDYVLTIKKSSETLLTILNDILDLSKIEAGKMELASQPLDIQDVLENLSALFKQKAFEKGNRIQFELDDEVPEIILGDRTRLLQILSNLTSNALKFTNNGLVQILVSQHQKNYIKFEIIDQGIGISQEDQDKLFSAFQQLDNSTSKSFGGTGLGLVISRELSRKMKGDMGVDSKLGEGSNFWFTIYAEPSTKGAIESHKDKQKIKLTNFFQKAPKLLLVDDNQVNRKVASEILLRAGCEIVTAESGQKAIDIFTKNQDFQAILMDIQMPIMDGLETTQRLRDQFGKKVPTVVAMTAYSMQNDREKFLANGMDDYVAKPIRAQTLIQKIDEIVGNAKPQLVSHKSKTPATQVFHIDTNVPRFDETVISGLREMVGAEMLLSVFGDFEKEAEEQLRNTLTAFKDNNVSQIQKELHTLKGNSGTIGLMRIHEITKSIETPAKEGNLEGFEQKYKDLKKEFAAFKKEYKKI